ncbi:MAG: hypothetical protein DRP68_02730 [Candidatus Omnitrophota bacterium]|nr:MAG: hypothetical protein DRP68_02730 [Candidatus Omnitrophota bacterium]
MKDEYKELKKIRFKIKNILNRESKESLKSSIGKKLKRELEKFVYSHHCVISSCIDSLELFIRENMTSKGLEKYKDKFYQIIEKNLINFMDDYKKLGCEKAINNFYFNARLDCEEIWEEEGEEIRGIHRRKGIPKGIELVKMVEELRKIFKGLFRFRRNSTIPYSTLLEKVLPSTLKDKVSTEKWENFIDQAKYFLRRGNLQEAIFEIISLFYSSSPETIRKEYYLNRKYFLLFNKKK